MGKYTYYAALLLIGLTPLDAVTVVDGISYGRLSFILLIICSLLSGDIYIIKLVKYVRILFLFTIWTFLTSIWSFSIEETLMRVLYLIQYLIIVIVLQNVIDTPERFKKLCWAWIVGSLYIAIQTINDFFTYGYFAQTLYRVDDYGNPNENSFMLCFAIILLLIINQNNLKRIWLYASLLFAFLVILANGSRTGLVMFIVIMAGLVFTLLKNKKGVALFIIPVFIIVAIYIFNNYLPESTYMRFIGISEDVEMGNLAHREEIWSKTYDILSNAQWKVFIGTGWGTFALVYQYYTGIYMGSHNFLINIIFTIGVIGFVIVVCYFATLMQYLRKTNGQNLLFNLLLIIPFLSMLTTNWESRRWWFLLGVFIYKFYYFSKKENCERKLS